jgi:hypothetical protein
MNKNIQNTIEQVSNSFPSLFSREDVIKLLTELDAEMQTIKHTFDKEALLDVFRDTFSDKNFDRAVDTDDVEFSLNYDNRIEVDRVIIDEEFIVDSAIDTLSAAWDALLDLDNNE